VRRDWGRDGFLRGSLRLLLADDCLENISRLGNVRQINFCLDPFGFGTAWTRRTRSLLRIAGGAKVIAHLLGFMVFKRTGMRLLLGNPNGRKSIKN
jgi:hypothetical protein